MRDIGKRSVLGVLVDVCDYESALARIMDAARRSRPLACTALAVHGVMTGVGDQAQRFRLNHLDLVVPDGQPVRWALNRLHGAGLGDRVYGPTLMLNVLEQAASEGMPVYFYGSRREVLDCLTTSLGRRFPQLEMAGAEPSKFRTADGEELHHIADRIRGSGARITFVGLGCPRQETFVYAIRDLVGMPILAVGAAFDYHASLLPAPPERWQRAGLEWLWRLGLEPGRLWKRYVLLNPAYLVLLAAQWAHLWRPDTAGAVAAPVSAVPC